MSMSTSSTAYQDQQSIQVPDFKPSPKQAAFLSSNAYETFFGGAAGPGKSAALCAEAVTSCLEDPGHHTYIFRKTIPELKQSVVPEIKKQCADYLDYMPYNSQDRRFNFSNGSFIQLAYCDNPGDYYRYQSAEIHTLLFDELTHFTQDEYEYLKTRVRSTEPRLLRIMSASNPGNIGHGWVKNYFIDVAPPQTIYTDPQTKLTRLFLPATIDDHPIKEFREQYRHNVLEAIPDASLKKALLDGDWNIFAGQVFNEWRRAKHVIPNMDINLDKCKIYCALDWGYNDPTSVHWIAVTPKNNYNVEHYIVFRERYDNKHDPIWWAKELVNVFKDEMPAALIMPHDTYNHQGGGKPIEQQFREVFRDAGLKVPIVRSQTKSRTGVIGRQALTHSVLSDSPDGRPYLQVMENCFNLIRTLPMLPYHATRVEEIDPNSEDHAYDSLSYGLYHITGGVSGIAKPKLPGPDVKSGYLVVDNHLQYNFDMEKALRATTKSNKDWRHM